MITKFILSCSLVLTFCRVNAQMSKPIYAEDISIFLEPPVKDTLIDKVIIDGKLTTQRVKLLGMFHSEEIAQ
jgi:hypothetical protein